MASFLEVADLQHFATINPIKAQLMIDDATAMAVMAAPCLETSELSLNQHNAVRAILRAAVLRWNEAGTGAVATQSAGPFAMGLDTRQERRSMFWPSEIAQLQSVCSTASSGVFAIDTIGLGYALHLDTCSVNFGGNCSCGAILTGDVPLYGA